MKKLGRGILLIVLMLISSLLVFAACGESDDKKDGDDRENETPAVTYTVSFYDGAQLVKTETVKEGGTASLPALAARENYRLSWLIGGNENTPFTEETQVTSDLNIYAFWQHIVKVTFDLNGGNGTAAEVETVEGSSVVLPAEAGFMKGEEGLYAWSDGMRQYAPGSEYVVGADTQFTAVWGARYTATFALDETVTGDAPAPMISTRGVVLPGAVGFSKAGYTFAGWLSGSSLYAAGETYPLSENVKFTAAFRGEYTLTLDAPEGSVENGEIVRRTGETIELPLPVHEGYKFLGWKCGDAVYEAGDEFTFGYQDVTLVAEWADEFTVSYRDWDGYTFASKQVKSGQTLPAPDAPFSLMDAEEFTGWKDAEGNLFTVGETPVTADVTLYAQYEGYTVYTVNDFSFVSTDGDRAYLIDEVKRDFLGAKTELYFPATFRGKPVYGTTDASETGKTFTNFLKGTADPRYSTAANSLQHIVVPSTWTVIGNSTFTNCRALTEITVNGAIERIGEWAFYYCYNLTSFTIPSALRELSPTSFSACASLENFVMGGENSNFSVQDGVLFNADKTELLCYNFGNARTSYEVPASVTIIGSYAFDHRGNYNLPKTEEAGSDGGYHLTGAITFEEGSRLETVSTYAFGYTRCTITLPPSLRTVNSYAFNYAEKEITFEEGLEELGSEAFRSYKGKSVALPSTLKRMKEGCMRGALSLESVTFPNGCNVTEIGDYAFADSSKIRTYPFNNATKLKTIGDYAFSTTGSSSAMNFEGEVKFPASLVSIGDYAFSKNAAITAVTFAPSLYLASIGTGAFGECIQLETVTFGTSQNLQDIPPQCFYLCGKLSSVTLPAGVRRIGVQAFAGTEARPNGLLSVTVPTSCVSIAAQAFEYNSALRSVDFQKGGTSDLEIGAAFRYCGSLESFAIPSRTVKIYPRTFEEVTSLKTITSESPHYKVENGGLYETDTNTMLYAYIDPASGVLNVSEGTQVISQYACSYNKAITTLNLPSTLTEIGGRAFYQATNLVTVTQAEGGAVQIIGDYSFSGSVVDGGPSMKLATFPFREGLIEIGTGAFENNTALQEVFLPASYYRTRTVKENILTGVVEEMETGGYAFASCAALQKIVFAENSKLENLPVSFASRCPVLEIVEFRGDASLKMLKGIAFMACPKLKTVLLPMHRVVEVGNNTFTSGDDSKKLAVNIYVDDALVERYNLNDSWHALGKCTPTFLPYSQYVAE